MGNKNGKKLSLLLLSFASVLAVAAFAGCGKKDVHKHTPGTPIQENVEEATYTKVGSYDEVIKCTECGEEISREEKFVAKKVLAGTGTAQDPVIIDSAAALLRVAALINDPEDTEYFEYFYKVTEDIDMTGKAWTPIGSKEKPFAGSIDGNNKAITNLTQSFELQTTYYAGFIGYYKGVAALNETANGLLEGYSYIKDLTLTVNFTDLPQYGGGLCGAAISGMIKNVTVKGVVSANKCDIGGIVGGQQSGGVVFIEDCVNEAEIHATGFESNWALTGGIIGENNGGKLFVKNCQNKGAVTAESVATKEGCLTGGIIGLIRAGTVVENCSNYANVSSTVDGAAVNKVGGIAGGSRSGALTGCFVADGVKINGVAVKELPCDGITATKYNGYMVGQLNDNGGSATASTNCYIKGATENYITVTFNAGTGTLSGSAVKACKVGDAVGTLPEVTAADGFEFEKWVIGEEEVTAATVVEDNVVITASYKASLFNGAGTETNPYILADINDLAKFAETVNAGEKFSGVYFKLTSNVDLSTKYKANAEDTKAQWTPIDGFAGILDCDNHEISNFYMDSADAAIVGFFKTLNGTFKNATFKNVSVVDLPKGNYGTACGKLSGGEVNNITVEGSISIKSGDSGAVVGTIATSGKVINCVNKATFTVTAGQSGCVVGATLAATDANGAFSLILIKGCKNYGTGTGAANFGGIIGIVRETKAVTITECYNFGNIKGTAATTGAICGTNRGHLYNCYALSTCTVNGATVTTATLVLVTATDKEAVTENNGLCDAEGQPIVE